MKFSFWISSALVATIAFYIIPPTLQASSYATASVQNIRYLPIKDHTQVIIELDLDAQHLSARLSNPDRIYFDISNARLNSNVKSQIVAADVDLLKQVRVAQNRPDVVRVVLNVSAASDYSVNEQHNPFRIVIDLFGQTGAKKEINSLPKASNSYQVKPETKPVPRLIHSTGQSAINSGKPAVLTEVRTSSSNNVIGANALQASASVATSVQSIRYWPEGDSTRVVIDLNLEAKYSNARLYNPDRIFFDISNAKLSSGLRNRTIAARIDLLKQVRVAQYRPDVVRVVLDVSAVGGYSIIKQQNPPQIVVDLYSQSFAMRESILLDKASNAPQDEAETTVDPIPIKATVTAVNEAQLPAASTEANKDLYSVESSQSPSPAAEAKEEQNPLQVPETATNSLNQTSNGSQDEAETTVDPTPIKATVTAVNEAQLPAAFTEANKDLYSVESSQSPSLAAEAKEEQNPLQVPETATNSLNQTSNTPQDETSTAVASNPAQSMETIIEEAPAPVTPMEIHKDLSSPEVLGSVTPQGLMAEAQMESYPPPQQSKPLSSSPFSIIPTAQLRPMGPAVSKSAKRPASANFVQTRSAPPVIPLTVNGTISSGYYSAFARGGGNKDQNIGFVPAVATFDVNGYFLTPDLLDYSVNPEFNVGPQANDAGFQGGNGVRARVTTLRRRLFPMTFRYSNVQLEDVSFGSLSQVSSYTLKNRNRELGATASFQHAGLPTTTIDWSTSSTHSQSFIPSIPDYSSHSNRRSINFAYRLLGWEFQGFTNQHEQTSNILNPLTGGTSSYELRQKVKQYQGSARRSFLGDSELFMDGGSQSTSNFLLNQPIDMTAHYANAGLRLFQKRRWKTSLRAGYTSNIAGLLLTRLVGGLGSTGSVAPDPSVLAPLQRTTSYLNLNALTSVDLSHGFGFFGSAERTEVLTSNSENLSSRYLTTGGGLTYAGTFGWGSISGQYGRTFGMGSVTGQTGRIVGQNYIVTVQPGKWEKIQLDVTVRGTDQRVFNEQPANEHGFSSEANIGFRMPGGFTARLGGGWQASNFTTANNDFDSKGYTAKAGIEHPRFQLTGSLNSVMGNSLQAYDQMLSGIGVGSTLLTPMHIIPSDYKGFSLGLHVIPVRRLEFSALWSRSVQHLAGTVANDFGTLDVSLTFHFRKLKIVGGYFNSVQNYGNFFSVYPRTERGRYYIRISRVAKFL